MAHAGSSSFTKALKETFAVYGFDLVGLLAGFLVAYQLGVFRMSPWAIALYPALLGGKSVIDGLLTGRLSTALHLGTVYPRFMDNTKSFYKLLHAMVFLTLAMTVAMSAISIVFGELFWGIDFIDFPAILAVVGATMTMGLLLLLVTVKVSFVSFKRGLDPDTLVYPLMGTGSSIFITLCYIIVLNLFFNFGTAGVAAVAAMAAVNLALVLYSFPRSIHEGEFTKTIQESLAALMTVALIVNLTGTILKGVDQVMVGNLVVYTGAIFTMYPALVGFVGDAGSVVSSTAITKLALGMLKPNLGSVVHNSKSVLSAWLVSVAMFLISAPIALLLNGQFSVQTFYTLVSIVLAANVLAVFLTTLLSHALSILIFQKGLDPGNFVLPIENAFIASITTLALFMVLAVMQLWGIA
jgi:mgtE-like transporter